jgi:pimeloyl-ACP methyl ester carboxylesterase
MAATQRPVTDVALTTGLPTDAPAWKTIPSWFVFGSDDQNVPAELSRFMAQRAGSRGTQECQRHAKVDPLAASEI